MAKEFGPARFARALKYEVGPRLDPDGYLPMEKELADPGNRLSFIWQNNGWLLLNGALEREAAALLAAFLEPRMTPRKNPDGTLDTRSTDERRGGAFAEWIEQGREATPVDGGERAQMTVTIGLEQLRRGLGQALLGPNLLPISVPETRRLACDCRVIPVILSAESMPLDIGRARRSIPTHIRRLVTERDRHSAFPDCVPTATERQVHHILEWQHDGEHTPPNLALLCRRHHRIIHHTDWKVRIATNGHPEFLPPPYVDPMWTPNEDPAPTASTPHHLHRSNRWGHRGDAGTLEATTRMPGADMTTRDLDHEQANKDRVQAAFDAWAAGTGGPFALLADDATWTIVGNSPASRTYHSRQEFLDVVIDPFNARMSTPLKPTVRSVFAGGDWVIVLFDGSAAARDGQPYENTYTWYLRLRGDEIVEAIAFFDTIEFTDLWQRVSPTPSPPV